MQVNMTAAQMTAVMQNAGFGGQSVADASFSGGFMELLMQLLGNAENGESSQLLGLFGAGEEETAGENLLQGAGDNGLSQEQQQNAMEMLAALLQGTDAQTAQQVMDAMQPAQQETLSAAPQALPGYFAFTKEQPVPQKNGMQADEQAQVPFTVETQAPQVKAVAAEDASAQALLGQGRFQSAVQKAKTLEAEESPKEEALDIQMLEDRVQTAAKADTLQGSRSQQLDTKDLAKQLTQSVPKALQEGKSEFTLKLKPEGLGEITVKLTQEGGKTAVTIASSLPQTEKLIGTQISTLEKALEPMGVTIRQEPMQQMAAQQQSMTDQNQQFMLWQQHQQQKQPGKGWRTQSETVEEILTAESAPETMLDAYI